MGDGGFVQPRRGADLIIRSHEAKDDGYEIHHGGKCITVFSAPNYWSGALSRTAAHVATDGVRRAVVQRPTGEQGRGRAADPDLPAQVHHVCRRGTRQCLRTHIHTRVARD
jgi:hypothetical protein